MQKKEVSQGQWEKSLEKEKKSALIRKMALWGGILVASVIGLIALVRLAGTSTSSNPVAFDNLPAVRSSDIIQGDKMHP